MIQLKVSKVVWLAKILKPAYQFLSLKPSIQISRLFSTWCLYRILIVNVLLADLNMKKSLLVGAFSGPCEISRRLVDSSSAYCSMCNVYSIAACVMPSVKHGLSFGSITSDTFLPRDRGLERGQCICSSLPSAEILHTVQYITVQYSNYSSLQSAEILHTCLLN